MKKILTIVALFSITLSLSAQHRINSFYDQLGLVRIETQELDENADTIATIFHRTDDVVWSRIIYRIIDMRFKQNYQLYFPTNCDDPKYWSLYRLIIDGIVNGRVTNEGKTEYLRVYRKNFDGLKPVFADSLIINRNQDMQILFGIDLDQNISIDNEDDYIVIYDSVNNGLRINNYQYSEYVRNLLKYLTVEVVFFDKHTSRFYQKILAIAPLNSMMGVANHPYVNLREQVRFWILFDDLRPFMARKYMIPTNNSSKRLTFDNFFSEHLYSSYIVGDDNLFDRMIVWGTDKHKQENLTEELVHREQDRIFNELLNTELDLWEY